MQMSAHFCVHLHKHVSLLQHVTCLAHAMAYAVYGYVCKRIYLTRVPALHDHHGYGVIYERDHHLGM